MMMTHTSGISISVYTHVIEETHYGDIIKKNNREKNV